MTDDFFRSRLEQMIDNNHPLAVLASRLPWEKMEAGVAPQFAHKERPLQQNEDAPDLAGPVVRVSGGKASNAGRPRLSMRLMIALTLLKNSFDLSDEELVQRFAENVYWQHFAGLEYFDPARRVTPPRLVAFAARWGRPAWKSCSAPPSTPQWMSVPSRKASSNASSLTP